MTQQEEQLLNGLIERVNSTQLQTKDTDAERLLQTSFGQNPDALYILCQTVLVQQFAMEKSQTDLQAAREEIERLRQSGGGEKHGSFLGNLFGLNKDEEAQPPAPPQTAPYNNPTGTSAGNASYAPVRNAPPSYSQPTGYYPPQGYAPQPGYPPPPPPPQAYPGGYPPQGAYYGGGYPAPPMGGGMFGGGGSFLQGAMQTAAGVVAGEMAFRALEDVFSSGHERGFTGGETVNNYYDNSGDRDTGGGFGDRLAKADGYDGNISSDIEDRRGESQGFFDGGDNSGSDAFADDSSNFDDSSSDFSGNDDNGF